MNAIDLIKDKDAKVELKRIGSYTIYKTNSTPKFIIEGKAIVTEKDLIPVVGVEIYKQELIERVYPDLTDMFKKDLDYIYVVTLGKIEENPEELGKLLYFFDSFKEAKEFAEICYEIVDYIKDVFLDNVIEKIENSREEENGNV